MNRFLRQVKEHSPIAAALLLFLFLAVVHLTYPGLYYDELHFLTSVPGGLSTSLLGEKLSSLPLFSVPYIGALKAWIYAPIFILFGVTVTTIRLPMILLAGVSLVLLYRIARRFLGQKSSLFASLILAINPAFVWAVKTDLSPAVLELFLQALATLLFLQGAGPLLLSFVIVLGLFNRITFLWWLAGSFAGAFLFFPEARGKLLLAGIAPVLFLIAWAIHVYGRATPVSVPFEFFERLWILRHYVAWLLDGSIVYRHTLGEYPGFSFGLFWILVAAGSVLAAARGTKDKPRQLVLFLAVQLSVTALAIFLTPLAISYWHFIHLLPWLVLVIAGGLSRWGKAGPIVFAILIAQLAYAQIVYFQKVGTPPHKASWSMAIYPLMEYCAEENRKCVSVDWGTNLQILSTTLDPARAWEYGQKPEFSPEPYYVLYSSKLSGSSSAGRDFLWAAETAGWRHSIVKTIEENGRPIFYLYRLEK